MKVAILDTGLDYTHDAYQSFMSEGTWDGIWTESDVEALLKNGDFAAEKTSSAAELYVSTKVPFAYDYADKDADVYPSYSNHGTHVAGIVAGYDPNGYTDKDGNHIDETFIGVAPDAQLVICKVFTDDLDSKDIGGAISEDILAALEDCVLLGVDVINMSLGTTAGFSSTIGDSEGDYMEKVYMSIQTAGISLIAAASNDYSSGYGGAFGTNLVSNPDSATVGSPSTYSAALAVASISGKKSPYVLANAGDATHEKAVFFEEANDENSNPYDFAKELLGESATSGTFTYVVIPNVGRRADYSDAEKAAVKGNIALVSRGDTTFQEKVETARAMGAAGIMVYNNVPGTIRMMLGEIEESKRIPAISINMKAGEAMVAAAKAGNGLTGTFTINTIDYQAGPFMSEFSSWGPTPDLKLKPEITAHGGEITSTVPGGYGEQSGTSMASPNMAGFATLVRSYVDQEMAAEVQRVMQEYNVQESVAINRLVNQLTMSTATIAVDQDGYAYSPRKQGAGLASLDNILDANSRTQAYIYTNNATNDYRPKVELGDTPHLGKSYDHNNAVDGDYTETISFNVRNFGASDLTFGMSSIIMTESVASNGLAVAEQAYMLDDIAPVWKVGGVEVTGESITIPAGSDVSIEVIISLSASEIQYIKNSFRNGMYVEGFMQLTSTTQSNLTVPFLGFLGDWTDGTMLDWSVYELAEKEQDTSIPDEEKPQASVYATQPFTTYYNETYVLPMGGYVYLLPDGAEPMYANEEYASVSRYNEYVSTDGIGNYMTSTSIKAVYTGLLRNASRVEYRMYNTETGELILSDTIHRVGKAYSGGGGARPANVELNIFPSDFGLAQNGKYTMEFDFYLAYGDQTVLKEDNKFEFSFTVDYDAPILESASVRYETTGSGKDEKNEIYLDLEIYDNHYPQSVMLCYLDKDKVTQQDILVLATEYITPVRKPVRNGISKVSLDITDIYEKYKGELYVQLDDYALNNCVYMLDYESLQSEALPDTFDLADGEKEITIAINESHKVKLVHDSNAPAANFIWDTTTKAFVNVKEGEIVGLRKGTGYVSVSNGKGVTKNIKVTVTDEVKPLKLNGISFGIVESSTRALKKAEGMVDVNAGQQFTLEIIPEPWYYPVKNLQLEWSTGDSSVVEIVDNNGTVRMLKEGFASVTASVKGVTGMSASVFFDVQDEFTVSNYTLTDYNGVGYNGEICKGCGEAFRYDELVSAKDDATNTRNKCPDCGAVVEGGQKLLIIPSDLNVMNIGEEAFKDNDNIEYIVFPKMLSQIYQAAFYNCTALKGIYFDSVKETEIDDCELSLMNDAVFYGCTNLEFIDLRNVKTFTIGKECFAGCTSLSEIKEMNKIGTMHHYAFQGCTSLTEANLEGLHMSGRNVFSGCTNLTTVTTGKFTALGESMFSGCNNIQEIVIKTPKIGANAFANLTGLKTVTFDAQGDSELLFDIGNNAFSGCRSLATVNFGDAIIRSIGNSAFANTSISSFTIPNGLKSIGSSILSGTGVSSITLSDSFEFDKLNMLGVAFDGLSINVDGLTNYQMVDGVLYNAEGSKLLLVTKAATGDTFTVANSVEEIFAYAFAKSKFKKVIFENGGGAIEIGVGAFNGAAFTEIDFGDRTFTEIKANTFASSKLAAIEIPASVVTIGDSAFARSSIATISFAKDVNENCAIQSLDNSVFANCSALTQVDLPAQITKMGNSVFSNCRSLTSVTMPAVIELGSQTFVGASSLQTVVFDDNATTAGTFTFMNTPVKSVTLGAATTKIEDGYYYFFEGYIGYDDYNYGAYEESRGVFSGCSSLETVVMPNVTYVGMAAFENCKKLSVDISNVTYIGDRAFHNCNAMSTIQLTNATSIGDYAFAIDNGGAAASTVSMPSAVTIGEYAFYGNSASEITIGADVVSIGQGAFAGSKKLTKFIVDANNVVFFADQDVLYRHFVLGEEDGTPVYSVNEYELVAYPSAKVGANGLYTVKEGTLSIKACAFNGLKAGALTKVELPYSVNTIGDAAFFGSGIKEYTFHSMQAPALETIFIKSVADTIDAAGGIYKGLYYRNFNDAIASYLDTSMSATFYNKELYHKTTSKLIINYPENAKGYDNYVYSQYFGVRNKTAVAMEDYTRECINLIESLPAASAVSAMTTANTTLEDVLALSEQVQRARTYFNNIKDETQISFIGSANAEKLLAVETALKAVKNAFGITVAVSKVTFVADSYQSAYYAGDAFNAAGLQFTLVYADGSTEAADLSQFILVDRSGNPINEHVLKTTDKYVTYQHVDSGKTVRVTVTVKAQPISGGGDSSTDSSSNSSDSATDSTGDTVQPTEPANVGVIIAICVGSAVVLAAAGVFVFLKVKGISLQQVFAKKSEEATQETPAKEDEENENE